MKYTVTATFDLGNDLDYYRLERGWNVHSWDDVQEYIAGWSIEELTKSLGYPEWLTHSDLEPQEILEKCGV